MKFKYLLIAVIAAAAGLAAGWFAFGRQDAVAPEEPFAAETGEETVWTCSMHPQVRREEPGDCPICGMELIPLSDASETGDPFVLEMTPAAVELAGLKTSVVSGKGPAGDKLRLNGRIEADETRAASVVSHLPGRIERLYVRFTGERIRKGRRVATVYSPDLITAQRELIEAQKLADVSPALLEAARNKLRYWKVPQAVIDTILASGTIREEFDIYADHGGIVMSRKVSVGDYIRTGDVLFEVQDLSRLWVQFDAYEEDLPAIRLGDRLTFTTPSVPGETFTGSISFIDPLIDPETRTATVRVEIGNASGLLKPDMFVTGTMSGRSAAPEVLYVPRTAVLWTGPRSVVYVELPDRAVPSYEFREVTLGEAVGDSYQVLGGLEAGESVVTYGAFVVDAAAQLNNRASMMNRNVSVKDDERALPDYTDAAPPDFREQLRAVVSAYLPLKDALVDSDPRSAAAAASDVLKQLSEVDMNLLKGAAHMYWMDRTAALEAHAAAISESGDLADQREQFEFLSSALIASVKSYGAAADTLYVQHCPMAIDNDGADWLSANSTVRNPYFGQQMLTCGINTDTLSTRPEESK